MATHIVGLIGFVEVSLTGNSIVIFGNGFARRSGDDGWKEKKDLLEECEDGVVMRKIYKGSCQLLKDVASRNG